MVNGTNAWGGAQNATKREELAGGKKNISGLTLILPRWAQEYRPRIKKEGGKTTIQKKRGKRHGQGNTDSSAIGGGDQDQMIFIKGMTAPPKGKEKAR